MEYWDLYDSERRPLDRTTVRGDPLGVGKLYICCEIWVINSKGQFLITKLLTKKQETCGSLLEAERLQEKQHLLQQGGSCLKK